MASTEHAIPGRVLIVEDDESTALFVSRVLERGGLESAWVPDAEQAGPLLEDEDFDVLLADYRLPGRNGVELARKARSALPELGIVVMTSFREDDLESFARLSGADDFFEKPLHSSTLLRRVRELVSRARVSGPRTPRRSSAGGGSQLPASSAPGLPPRGGGPGAPVSAEGGPSGQPPLRGSGVVRGSTDRSRDGEAPWLGGTGGASWARASALHPSAGADKVGCEGVAPEELPPEGLDRVRSGLFVRVPRECGPRPSASILLWASSAPGVSVDSAVAPVKRAHTIPSSPSFGA